MSKNSGRILLAFVVGQGMQLVLALLAKVSYMNRPILFCLAAGFILALAVVAGMRVILLQEQERPRSYHEWAEDKTYEQ